MSEYYDRQGNPITMQEWGAKGRNPDYKRVDSTTLPDGTWVSTVWLGLDHGFGEGLPVIFETMVFSPKPDMRSLDCERYCFENEAIAGHQQMVEKWRPQATAAAEPCKSGCLECADDRLRGHPADCGGCPDCRGIAAQDIIDALT